MRTKRALTLTGLNFEALEERCLLAGIVGSFERIETSVYTQSRVIAGAKDLELQLFGEYVSSLHLNALEAYDDNRAYALDIVGAGALNLDITPLPLVSAGDGTLVTVDGMTRGRVYEDGHASGTFQYDAPPEFSGDLEFHGHMFIAAGGHETATEDTHGYSNHGVVASINEYHVGGGHHSQLPDVDATWDVSGILPEGSFSDILEGGVFAHKHFVIPITDESLVDFESNIGADVFAASSFGSASISWAKSSWAWGYVTAAGEDLIPGDFNGDGNVDGGDLDIWADGQPLADTGPAYNGIIDANDYAVWTANVDAIFVSTNVDESDGNYSFGDLSLREAIALAADASHPGADIIAFDESLLGSTITLTMGQLNIGNTNEVKILGPGVDQLTIDANGNNLMFAFAAGGSGGLESTISHLKLAGTSTSGTAVSYSGNNNLVLDALEIVDNGYGVRHSGGGAGQLSIVDSVIAENYLDGVARATHSPADDMTSVTISNSTIRDNGRSGVALRNLDVSISNSEITGNNTLGLLGNIGGVNFQSESDNPSVTLTIVGSTIAENNGPGITVTTDSIANISNTTISSNDGLGLSVTNATATLTNVTVTQNRVATSGATAGVYAGASGTITLHNTIVAQNYSGPAGSEVEADLGRATATPAGSFAVGTSSYNLIGVVGNSGITSSNNNIILGAGVDAGLTALGDHGGPTRTHALLATSLAIDAGDNAKATALGLLYDQRDEDYDRIVDWWPAPQKLIHVL